MLHFIDCAKPGVIAVTRGGVRLVNEGGSCHDFVQQMSKTSKPGEEITAFLISAGKHIAKAAASANFNRHINNRSAGIPLRSRQSRFRCSPTFAENFRHLARWQSPGLRRHAAPAREPTSSTQVRYACYKTPTFSQCPCRRLRGICAILFRLTLPTKSLVIK
jgi:hypothetical protein